MATPIAKKDLPNHPNLWDETIEAFNELIQEKWDGKQAKITQDEAVVRILDKYTYPNDEAFRNKKRDEILHKHQLDVENIYREKGFIVEYDKPGWNETYDAFFIFK